MSGNSKRKILQFENSDPTKDMLNTARDLEIMEQPVGGGIIYYTPDSDERFTSSSFIYQNFQTTAHFEPKVEYPDQDNKETAFKAQIDINYNFLAKLYEEFLNEIPEGRIPSFYNLLNEKLFGDSGQNRFDGQSMFDKPAELIKITQEADPEDITFTFPNKFGASISQLLGYSDVSTYLKSFNSFKNQFPFYTEISIDTHKYERNNSTFNGIIEENNLFQPLVNSLNSQAEFLSSEVDTITSFGDMTETLSIKSTLLPNSLIPETIKPLFRKLAKEKRLEYEDIINNRPCYSEVIGYGIYKYDISATNPNPIDVIYVPNFDDVKLQIIDNKIKYGSFYSYKITLIVMVLGNEITFKNRTRNPSNGRYELEFDNMQLLKLFEIDSTRYENILLDAPPIEPDVEIVPFISVDTKFKINLATAIGKKEEVFIPFNQTEKDQIDMIKMAQDRYSGQKVLFKSEEPSEYFLLYRLENPPSSYSDFIDAESRAISKTEESSAGSIDETVKPNTKYYYTFRAVDYHGHVSNPSPVYQIELVNDNGLIYPNIQIYSFEQKISVEPVKDFRRYLYLAPAYPQKKLNFQGSNLESYNSEEQIKKNIILGTGTNSLWDKKFKVRIRSKSTGRMLDLNVIFAVNKD